MPDSLPLDNNTPLSGTMAAYAQQLVVCTGQRDWESVIERDGRNTAWGALVKGLKSLLGRGGSYADPYNNVLITNSSFHSSPISKTTGTASAILFPSFKYFPTISVGFAESQSTPTREEASDLSAFVRAFLLPTTLHPMHSSLPDAAKERLTRASELQFKFSEAVDIKYSPTILICGHGGRDRRCGLMGPALQAQFEQVLKRNGFSTSLRTTKETSIEDHKDHANVALISHIGGHKFAGNVIVYIPPGTSGAQQHPLAGMGIWYGRVEPQHVEGIVRETVMNGSVLARHFRGAITQDSEIVRISNIEEYITP